MVAGTRLVPMTDDTRALVAAARRCAEAAWKDGFAYAKAGVILDDLRRREDAPRSLFEAPDPRVVALMGAMDQLNAKYGRNAVFPAAMGIRRSWKQRADHCSPRYTTRLSDLPVLRA